MEINSKDEYRKDTNPQPGNIARVFITGEAGVHNLGDEGMALASVARIRKYFNDIHFVATAYDVPYGTVLRHQAEIVRWPLLDWDPVQLRVVRVFRKILSGFGVDLSFWDPKNKSFDKIFESRYRSNQQFREIIKKIEEADFVFDMGHGALNDIFSPLFLCFLYYCAHRVEKPLFISGQNIGPLWKKTSIKMLRMTLPFAHTVGLRDKEISKRILLDEVGIDENSVKLVEFGDDTLDLEPEEPDWSQFNAILTERLKSGDFFAVQWRGSDYSSSFSRAASLLPLAKLIEEISEKTGMPAVFVPFTWEWSGDFVPAAHLEDLINNKNCFSPIWNLITPGQAKWIMGRARFAIGLSYHFNVFALTQGVPVIGIYTNEYYRIKLDGAFGLYGHGIKAVKYGEELAESQELHDAVDRVLSWTDDDRIGIAASVTALRNLWHGAFSRFLVESRIC